MKPNQINLVKSKVFLDLERTYKTKVYTCLRGGKRSGKTFSLLQFLLYKCLTEWKSTKILVLRKERKRLTETVVEDFKEILMDWNVWDETKWRSGDLKYTFNNGNTITFKGLDDESKARGVKADICWINEPTEIKTSVWKQIKGRISGLYYFDFNPSDARHWINTDVCTDADCIEFVYTYKDNNFLSKQQVKEIEKMQFADYNNWLVFGLGQYGIATNAVYSHHKIVDNFDNLEFKTTLYGSDYGYSDGAALIEINITHDDKIYLRELIYKKRLTSYDYINEVGLLNIQKNKQIICDNARPELIEDLKRAGYYQARGCNKSKGKLYMINTVKKYQIYIHKDSNNLIDEINGYSWELDKYDEPTDTPEDGFDHLLDAMLYGIFHYYHVIKPYFGHTKYNITYIK